MTTPAGRPGRSPKPSRDLIDLLETVAMRQLRHDPQAPATVGRLPNGEFDGRYESRCQEFALAPYHVRAARDYLTKLGMLKSALAASSPVKRVKGGGK